MANSIIAGNDFRLIIRAKKSTGAYLADMDLADVEDLRIYLTRAGRSKVLQSYTLDEEGHAVIYVSAGVVTNATYGIEMVGVYGGARLRAHNTSVFTISGHGGGNSGVLNDYYADIVFVINVAATDVYVQNAIEAHNEDEASHPHLLQLIGEAGDVDDVQIDGESIVDENKIAKIDSSQFGKVDDVKVNGMSVVSNKEANITIPEKVSDLPNDADYATKSELTTGLDAKQDTITAVAEPTIADDGGNPSASVDFEDGEMAFSFRNLKLRFSDLTPEERASLKGDKGDQGDSAVYDPDDPSAPDFVMANTTGQSTTKAMTQKAVTDELDIKTAISKQPFTDGYGIKVSDGTAGIVSGLQASDYVDISDYDYIYIPCVRITTTYGYAFYNASKVFIANSGGRADSIGTYSGYELKKVAVPAGAKYVRYTVHSSSSQYSTGALPPIYFSSSVKDKITKLNTERTIPTTEKIPGIIAGNGKWNTTSGCYSYQLFVKAGWIYRITANNSAISIVRWLTEEVGTPVNNQNAPLSAIAGAQIVVSTGATMEYVAPADAKVLCLYAAVSTTDYTPASVVEIAPVEELLLNQRDSINLVDEGGVYRAGSLLFNKDMVPGGSTIWVSFRTINSNATFIRFNDALGTQLAYFGKSSSSTSPNRYEGFVTLPSDYVEARIASTTNAGGIKDVKITASQINYTVKHDVAREMIATQIMRSCKSISQGVLDNNLVTKNAFSANMFILDGYAYVSYYATDSLNGDNPTPQGGNKGILQKISLETMEVIETMNPATTSFLDENGNELSGYKATAFVPVKNGNDEVARFGQITKSTQHKPIFAYNDFGYLEDVENITAKAAVLQYTDTDNTEHDVQFSVANYRQMLVDMGYIDTYYAPAYDSFDNNAVFYNPSDGKYYDLMCTVSSNFGSLPLMLMVSDDLATWTVKARVGTDLWKANEIHAVCKGGKIYAALRELDGMKWIVYDIANDSIIDQGVFPNGGVLSRPYVFTYLNDIYMAINVGPSIYGLMDNVADATTDKREEIIIYKVKDDNPYPLLRVNNPSGINYHCWAETAPVIATGSTPMTNYGSIFCAFSEDRRHLYRRAFSQVSFGDVTALFCMKDIF